jgi:hypothetical protein
MTFSGSNQEGNSHERPSFLSLPGEVRNTIYALLFSPPGSTIPLSKQHQHTDHAIFRSASDNHISLFLSCHPIRNEASSLFYPCHTFSLPRPTQLPLYIRDLTPHTLSQLSYLSISVTLALSSLSRRGRRRRKSLSITTAESPSSQNKNAAIAGTSTILTQNRELNQLSKFTTLKVLTLSLNIEACSLQRYLAPSHVVALEDLVPRTAEIRVEVGKCGHCAHWYDSTSNPMEKGDVKRGKQWWRWTSTPRPSVPAVKEKESGQGLAEGKERDWFLERRIGGVVVDIQPFPAVNQNANVIAFAGSLTESGCPDAPPPVSGTELLSRCYTCKKPLRPPNADRFPSHTGITATSTPLHHYHQISDQDYRGHIRGQTCEVCGLVSFCSNLCFAACVEHQHLCVPRPFG